MFTYNKKQVNIILDLFKKNIQTLGKDLYLNNEVFDIFYDKTSLTIESLVAENLFDLESTANVTIKMDRSKRIKSMSCDCDKGSYCQHIYATLLSLDEAYAVNEGEIHEQPIKEKALFIKFSQIPGKFALIPCETKEDFVSVIQAIKPNHPQYFDYHQRLKIVLTPENNISVHLPGSSYNYYPEPEKVVEIKAEKNDLYVKCNSCNTKTNRLCPHAFTALDTLSKLKHFYNYWNKIFDYNQLVDNFALEKGLTSAFTRKTFEIHLGENILFIKLNDQLLLDTDIANLQKELNRKIHLGQVTEEAIFGSKRDLETLGNGLIWHYEGGPSDNLMPLLFSAKYNKARTKQISNFIPAEKALFFSNEQRNLYNEFNKIIERNAGYPEKIIYDQLIQLFTENITLLNSCNNYTGDLYQIWQEYQQKFKRSQLEKVKFFAGKLEIYFTIDEIEDDLVTFETVLKINGEKISFDSIITTHPLFLLIDSGNAFIYNKVLDRVIISQMLSAEKLLFPKSNVKDFAPTLNQLSYDYEVKISPPDLIETEILYGGKKELYFSDLGQFIIIRPYINFENKHKQNAITKEMKENIDSVLFEVKGSDADIFLEELAEMHSIFEEALPQTDFFSISIADFLHDNWFFDFFDKCKTNEIEVFGTDLLSNFKFNKNKANLSNIIKSGIDWFETDVKISFGKLNVPLQSWVEMVKNNQKYIQLSDGTLGIIPEEWIEKLKVLYNVGEIEDGQVKISKYHFSVVEEYFEELVDELTLEDIQKKQKAFENYASIKAYKLPSSIKADLRNYQLDGYRWLRFLDEYGLGGCLADDMGLGKTLQFLSLLAYKKQQKECFTLTIVPNSLIFNWANEIEKFCPSLRYLVYHGPNRNIETINKKKFDVIITTYGTALADIKELKEIDFETIVLDESQAIKNPSSKRYKAMKLLNAQHRYALTGTPIENNTFDLFAQFSFLNPGLLGNANSFRRKFAVPIDGQGDPEKKELLRRVINPFILRRTKEQVAKDLPEKSENVIICEMGDKQKKYYDSVKNDIKNSFNKSLKTEGLGKAKFQMLEGLLRLRQICNSPRLIDKDAANISVKIDTLIDQLQNTNTHKSLVFSQFVGMLHLIRDRLDELNIKYAYLDGSTKHRQEEVDRFQEDKSIQVFLISLKAGNTGLNLTAADYVYLVDPWWNPAAEAQAIDRTHRIGQTNHVFAYRLVCKDTIEEKILQLQSKKKILAQDIIQADESILKSLDKDDMISLFE